MPKFKDIITAIFEEEEPVVKSKKGLHIYYVVDILVKEEATAPEQTQAPEQVVPAVPTATPTVAVEGFYTSVNKYLNEDVIDTKRAGTLLVPETEVANIQTIDDLMDFLVDKKDESGRPILNEFAVELVLTLTGGDGATQQVSDLLKKEDKVLIEIDYGDSKEDSVGIKVLKRSGVDSASVMFKKDGDILPGKFSIESFNNQIITYRNSMEKK